MEIDCGARRWRRFHTFRFVVDSEQSVTEADLLVPPRGWTTLPNRSSDARSLRATCSILRRTGHGG
jgi:hypothetical protein